MEKEQLNKVNLIEILLLIIRTLIIITIILMISRPIVSFDNLFTFNSNGASYSGLIIDDSISTYISKDREQENHYKNILDKLLASIETDSHVEIYTTSRGLQYSGNIENFEFKILNFNKIFSTSPLTPSIQSISRKVELQNYFIKRIFLIGDKKINSFIDSENINLNGFEVYYHPHLPLNDNVGLVDYSVLTETLSINQNISIDISIKNYSFEKSMRTIELIVNNQKVGQKFVSLEPNELKNISFKTTLFNEGQNNCYFKIDDDFNNIDNQIYFQLNTEKPLLVDLIFNDENQSAYIFNALTTLNQNLNNITIRKIDKNAFSHHNLSDTDLAIIFGYNSIIDSDHSKISSFLNEGKRLIIFPSFLDSESNNDNISLIDFFQFNVSDKPINIDTKDSGKMINNQDSYKFSFGDLENIRFYSIYSMLPESDAVIVFKSGESAWNRYSSGNSSIDLFSFSPDYKSTNFVLSSKFIPFCHFLINPSQGIHSYMLNESFNLPNKYNHLKKISHTSPSDNSEILKFSKDRYLYSIKNFQEPGFHLLSDGSKTIESVSVNVPPNEYNSEQLNKKTISQYFENLSFIDNIEDSKSIISNNLRGAEIWNYLIFILCILFIIEMYLYTVYLNGRK